MALLLILPGDTNVIGTPRSKGYVHWDVAARNVGIDSKLACKLANFNLRKVSPVDEIACVT